VVPILIRHRFHVEHRPLYTYKDVWCAFALPDNHLTLFCPLWRIEVP
jgi:hypothetical protein